MIFRFKLMINCLQIALKHYRICLGHYKMQNVLTMKGKKKSIKKRKVNLWTLLPPEQGKVTNDKPDGIA